MDNKSELIHQRTKIISLYVAGYKKSEIVKETGCQLNTVSKWIKKYSEFGKDGLIDNRCKNKRKRKTTRDEDEELYRAAKENNFNSCKSFADRANLNISQSTISRRLKEKGLVNGKTCKKILLTEDNRRDRIKYCRDYSHWTSEQWANVIWSDEKTCKSVTDNRLRVWREKNTRMVPENVAENARSSRISSMYWG
ncbi:Similar to Transposable element Tcb1 transposase (Caenorhabditis briggsae) [Cotesia congregata]|uniref:Similar to Transposable element Tcb1 transposase (Caenorhabditis briggsae) n=1 Tax=Cotesia congregata TaxID=51543 RepID=A0A8J2HB56_COTCN|nr:Similar to Transposable element Tcb1 transposase (Caenorhabditis briggsae) [Cotesia congregata]